ncbi:YiiD C-terminal domain-containing protein [Motiliproteus sediminis]|uniref:YiiD C-terminal domain-containing protein n=1 Tax=Motiliproteus sediminis TaxID=1468178 RepID=UPI001AEF5697|nr:YiiD C-terminal domain-containing protein [Motiliproteus sediminis]
MLPWRDITAFEQNLRASIPLVEHLGFRQLRYDGCRFEIDAALAPNHNDKGTAFAGSLSASANLCGWSAITLLLESEEQAYDVVIRDGRQEYFLPVTRDFCVATVLPEPELVDRFLLKLRERGKARMDLVVEVQEQGQLCFRQSAAYVALRRKRWV